MIDIIIIVVLLLLLCFFSSAETVLTAASKSLMKQLELDGNKQAAQVNSLYEKSDRLLGAILLGNTLIQIVVSSMATTLVLTWYGETGVAWETIILTMIVLVFCEITPKTIMLYNANQAALFLATPMRILSLLLGTPMIVVQGFVKFMLRSVGLKVGIEADIEKNRAELRGAIEIHAAEEEVCDEGKMLRSIMDLGDVSVGEVMTHRGSLVTIDGDLPVSKILEQATSSPYTRFPVWRGKPDNIIGIIHSKALLRTVLYHNGSQDSVDITALLTSPWFVPESTNLLDQLHEFRLRREHFSMVVDEYGAILGIVTLEDIIEEIVGDIVDEHDIHVTGVWHQPDGSMLVNGEVTLRDLNREFDWRLPDENATTIAGLLMYESRIIPEVGQVFCFYGFRFEVTHRLRNQIVQIRLTPLASRYAGSDAGGDV